MKKIKSILGLILFFMIVLTVPVFADSGKINSINYNILITEDSKLEITEVWDVNLNNNIEHIVKKVPEIKPISNVKVKEYNKDGSVKKEYELVDVNNLSINKYSVKDNEIDIFVNKDVNNEKRFFSIEYTIENHINAYLDCAEFDLILQDKKFAFNSEEITGKITFSKPIGSLAGFNAWVHSDNLSSVTKVEELSQINFFVDGNNNNRQLDIKVAFPTEMLSIDSNKIIHGNRLKLIYEEEIAKTEEKTDDNQRKFIMNMFVWVVAIVSALLAFILIIVLIVKIRKIRKEKKELKRVNIEIDEKNNDEKFVKNQEVETLDKKDKK